MAILFLLSGQTKKQTVGGHYRGTYSAETFNAMYYMVVHNRSGGNSPPPPITRALFLLLACLMRQYCFAGWRLSSSVTLPACGPAGRPAAGLGDDWCTGGRARGKPTLHGGPVLLCPVPHALCMGSIISYITNRQK